MKYILVKDSQRYIITFEMTEQLNIENGFTMFDADYKLVFPIECFEK